MIEEQALVLSVEDETIKVRVDRQNACASCQLKSGCGQRALTELSNNKCIEFAVINTLLAKPGDRVLVAIPDEGLLKASFVVYFLPLISMLMFAIACKTILGLNDAFIALFGLLGLVTGFVFAKYFDRTRQHDPQFVPELTRIIS